MSLLSQALPMPSLPMSRSAWPGKVSYPCSNKWHTKGICMYISVNFPPNSGQFIFCWQGYDDVYYFEFFDAFRRFLDIPPYRVKCFRNYEGYIKDAPPSERSPRVFVLESVEQRRFLLDRVAMHGRINFGDIKNCACKGSKHYWQQILVREMMTNYNSSLLKEAERYVSQGRLRYAFFKDGLVHIRTNVGDTIPVRYFSDLECYPGPPCSPPCKIVVDDPSEDPENYKKNSSRRVSFEEYQCYDNDTE